MKLNGGEYPVIYAMSDIHGCMEELKKQMEYVDLSGENRIVFLGDYIDGSVYKGGKLLLLGYDEADETYYQIEHGRKIPVRKFEEYR